MDGRLCAKNRDEAHRGVERAGSTVKTAITEQRETMVPRSDDILAAI